MQRLDGIRAEFAQDQIFFYEKNEWEIPFTILKEPFQRIELES